MSDTNIVPDRLKAALKRHHMTQQQLADKIGCTKDTVSRWMRGKNRRVRSHLRQRLEEALHMSFGQLTESAASDPSPERVEMRFSLRRATRNALRLVADRYNIPQALVVDYAPLLFLLAAERSLVARGKQLDEVRARIEEMNGKAESLQHVRWGGGEEGAFVLAEEEKSIAARDIFGRNLDLDARVEDYMRWDPLLNFLEEEAKRVPDEAVTDMNLGYEALGIGYEIAADTLRECTGLSEGDGSTEDDRALGLLSEGWIDLNECLRIKRKEDEKGYRLWLRKELERIDREDREFRKRLTPEENQS